MADDIDIVEHNLLDDPKIKDIFPDITSIKTEVIDQDDEENQENNEDDGPMETDESIVYQPKIILGSKPCSSPSGSNTSESHVQETSIVVKESGLHLHGNSCYCEDCKILFPTENALDLHKSSFHSFLVRRNKAVKSTTKGPLLIRKIKSEPGTTENESVTCNHCNEAFPNEIAFLKHSYELLPRSFKCDLCDMEFENDAAFKNHQTTHSLSARYVCCPICTCRFRNKDKLAGHMRMFHEFVENVVSPSTSVEFNCENCDCVLPDCKRYNQHIHLKHPDLYYKVDEDRDKYKCLPCNLSFPSAYSEKIHKTAQHAKPVEKVNLNKQEIEESEPIPSTSAVNESQTNFVPIPKSTLFKCTKCQVNFLSITIAVEHFKTCEYRKGNLKCQICRRFVQKSDIGYHLKQHENAERLKSIKIRDVNILSKIICVCKKCQVCYDEKGFQKCHAEDCKPKKNAECSLCGLIIDEDYMIQHSNAHATGVKAVDFIEVDYTSVKRIKSNPLETQVPEMDRTARPKHQFYCPSCNCFLKINRRTHGHGDGTCNKNNVSSLCKLCGLRFTTKGMNTHKREHNKYPNLKLRDMKFTNTQTGKRIDPPFPIFKKCKDCNAHFVSDVARRGHLDSEVFKTCAYCNEKFSDVAFKLHVPFHKYGAQDKKIVEATPDIPEILITYESLQTIWNILYLCETCDTIIDTYDTVVEHCQDHFCNMESYNTTINSCNICKLKFVGNSFERHEELHAENDINKNSFIILKFNYEKLLTKEWFSTFDSLAKEQVSQILSKSVYQFTRNIRMEIAVDGPSHLTMYKCGICNAIVKSTSIVEHAQNNTCAQHSNRYNCLKCNLGFSGRNMKSEHDKLHESRNFNSNSYRIIVFNSKKNSYINDVLRSKLRPAGLHFKRCQQCGKLIKKEKFHKHYSHHIYYQKVKMRKKQPKVLVRPHLGRMVHTFYTCRRCKISVLLKNTVKLHRCNDAVKLTKCNKCSLMIRSSSLQRHFNYHDKYPKMTRSDLNIVYFQAKNKNNANFAILGRTENNELVFYQCVRCSIAVQRETNIKRHNCSSKLNRKNCSLCEMPFHSAHFGYHRRLHEQINFSKAQVVIIKFKDGVILNNVSKVDSKFNQVKSEKSVLKHRKIVNQVKNRCPSRRKTNQVNHEFSDREFYRLLAYRLYKCSICKLLFITGSALVEHQKVCRTDNTGVECNNCGLIFHSSMIKYHINLQKCNFKTSINIVSLEVNANTYYDKNVIYLCRQCNVYNISLRGIKYHLDANHRIGKKTVQCTICDVTFSSVSYGIHKKLHHYKKNNTLSDLVVATVEIMTLQNALKHLPNKNEIKLINLEESSELDIPDNKGTLLKRKLSIPDADEDSEQDKPDESCITPVTTPRPKVPFDKSSLYKCDICDLNFLHPKTLKRHMDIGRHDEERYNCTDCDLMFTKISYTRHLSSHERLAAIEEYRSRFKNESKSRKSRDNSIGMEESLQSPSRDRARVVQESPCNSVQRVQESAYRERVERPEQSNTKVELFKCSACDVYFLRDDICRDHITNHIPLDPTEYIACKICDLQFLCEYLGSHMRTHRDQSFNIDKLIVTEYQIYNRIEINVDTYSAADRLKSKLVSTTTHFDTEDEKNAIDSTTDHVDRLDVLSVNSNQSGMRSNSQMNSPMDVDS